MVKTGPCYHCGITSTPLWRNGPPEKPVLCNACGTRWRIRGTLADYTPLHSLAPCEIEKNKSPSLKTVHGNNNIRAEKLQKTKHKDDVENEYEIVEFDVKGEEKSNNSSTGSAVSYSESCTYLGAMDVNCTTGSAQSDSWETFLPSQKVTVSRPKVLHVEKLTKDLNHILHQQSQSLLSSSEEDLLYENGLPMGSTEIGHGGFLIKSSISTSLKEESKTSSVTAINNSTCSVLSVHSNVESSGSWNSKMRSNKFNTEYKTQEHLRRNKSPRGKFHIQHRDSWLGSVDLKDVINFDVYMQHLTLAEQQQLLKYLPSVDTSFFPASIKNFFTGVQLEENICWFQQLIKEGVFDLSFPFSNSEECTHLKKLILLNLSKSRWLEYYNMLKDTELGEYGENGGEGLVNLLLSPVSSSLKRVLDSQTQPFQESKTKEKSRRMLKPLTENVLPSRSFKDVTDSSRKSDSRADNTQENGESYLSMNRQFPSSLNASSTVNLLPVKNDNQESVLEVHSDSSFPQPEFPSDREQDS